MRTPVVVVACVALFVSSGVSRAVETEPFTPDSRITRGIMPSREDAGGDSLELKSPQSAAWLSLAGTLVPLVGGIQLGKAGGTGAEIAGGAAIAGVLVGPSLGYFYGGCSRRGITGIAVRAGLSVVGLAAASQAEWPSLLDSDDKGNAAAGIVVLAVTGVFVDMVIDLVRVSGTVRRENDRRRFERPAVMPTARAISGSTVPALGITVSF